MSEERSERTVRRKCLRELCPYDSFSSSFPWCSIKHQVEWEEFQLDILRERGKKEPCMRCSRSPLVDGLGRSLHLCAKCWSPAIPPIVVPPPKPTECAVKGCKKKPKINNKYCSPEHQLLFKKGNHLCLVPKCENPASRLTGGKHFTSCCSFSHSTLYRTSHAQPGITVLPHDHPDWSKIKHQFESKWLHSNRGPAPEILHIAEVTMAFSVYLKHKQFLEPRKNLRGHGHGGEGNTQRRFHGTNQLCDLCMDGKKTELCASPVCAICNIIKMGLRVSMGRQRYGSGVYCTSTSSKADDYSEMKLSIHPSCPMRKKGLRSMFVCSVVMGNTHKVQEEMWCVERPPGIAANVDTVVGDPGKALNYDEACSYDASAAIPRYLIVYKPQ